MIRIVVDTGANMTPELREQFHVLAVPLYVSFGTTSYRDEVELTKEQFLKLLKEGKHHPITSQPTPNDFAEVFRPLLASGNEIICISISSKLSGTYASAAAAKKMLDAEFGGEAPISVVDTPFVSMGQGFLAIEAERMAQKGAPRADIVEALNALAQRINILFLLDTLEYLRRGGRIGRAQALIGGMLNVKPMIEIKNGALEPLERARSRVAGLKRLLEIVQERAGDGNLHVAALHFAAAEEVAKLEAELRARFKIAELYTSEIGPVIATHGGPGIIGLVFYKD